MNNHEHWCKPCGRKILKYGVIVYVAHWVLHVLAFVVSPVLGAWFLTLM